MYFGNSFFNPLWVYLRKIERRLFGSIALKPPGKTRGWVLLSYVTHPFAITKEVLNKSPHTNPWECLEIAGILLKRGFAVDIIDYTNFSFIPKKKYKMAIDIDKNLERLIPHLPKDCVKIFYITGAYWEYQNEAEKKRLRELSDRRGILLKPRRQASPSKNIEVADYATSLGNDFAKSTYDFARKKIARIPLLSVVFFPSPEKKVFSEIRKNFVWIGGGGAVHKGLDLVLEFFAANSEFNLTICGPVEGDEDFYDFYRRELYDRPNIKFVGRIDIRGTLFKSIVEKSVGLIYPSCSEGQSGSVTVAIHAGLIPIVTPESGVNVEPFGIELKEISPNEIRKSIEYLSGMPEKELKSRAVAAWQNARANYTSETFRMAYEAFIDLIIKERNL